MYKTIAVRGIRKRIMRSHVCEKRSEIMSEGKSEPPCIVGDVVVGIPLTLGPGLTLKASIFFFNTYEDTSL